MSWEKFTEQPRVAEILSRSLRHDRLAHAYLFTGPRGVGKKQMAIHLTKSLLCTRFEADACDECLNCRRINSGNHPDVYTISPEGESIKIDQVRSLQKEMTMRSLESPHKVYILEHIDKMTLQAANSLLKFLEEPPAGVIALLLTENSHAILPTIVSRCQVIPFSPLSASELVRRLAAEGIPAGVASVASQITSHLDEAREISQSDGFAQLRSIVIQLTKEIKQRSSSALFTIHEQFLKNDRLKEELSLFLDLLILWLRDILYVQVGRHAQLINSDQRDVLEGQALQWTQGELLHGIGLTMDTRSRIGRNANPQLALERLVLQLQEGL
ncbi:DNA polymerase III subunit delta' [Brevibacillus sp. B_LB10_24]|jgi:DNA polymerase-3 subunit delta'|uniref:DNA polymerase III subunit delta' n=1 Tax=Brevibacillus TaxID=55080 RepID=UPI00030C6042|nr:DNA polymerase III subunit delta' [Brevibacillus massiliensis]